MSVIHLAMHQNNFFLIRASLVGPANRKFEVYTHPIKSVSKPEQIRRRVSLQQAPEEDKNVAAAASKKRARSEELLATLEEMKETQKHQSEMLALLLSQQQIQQLDSYTPFGSPSQVPSVDEALALLVRAYEATESFERPTKFRKIAAAFPARDRAILSDIGRVLTLTDSKESTVVKTEIPPPSRTVTEPTQTHQTSFNSSQFPLFDLGTVGVDVSALDGEALLLLNESLCGWIQANDCV